MRHSSVPEGASAIHLVDHVFTGDSSRSLPNKLCAVSNPDLLDRVAVRAKSLVLEKYNWDMIGRMSKATYPRASGSSQ